MTADLNLRLINCGNCGRDNVIAKEIALLTPFARNDISLLLKNIVVAFIQFIVT